MTTLYLMAPDGSAWPVETRPTPDGVLLIFGFTLDGEPLTLQLNIDRAAARTLARGLNADAGDGIERTYPHPPIEVPHG